MEFYHNREPEELLSRLSWNIHFVEMPFLHFNIIKNIAIAKIFIGKIDKSTGNFVIRRVRKNLSGLLPQIYIKGSVKKDKIDIRYRPGLLTLSFYLFLLYGLVVVIWQIINSINTREEIFYGIIWFSIFILGAILLTLWEINKTFKIINDLLELNN